MVFSAFAQGGYWSNHTSALPFSDVLAKIVSSFMMSYVFYGISLELQMAARQHSLLFMCSSLIVREVSFSVAHMESELEAKAYE
jgi:hypothetical protein